MVAPAQWFGGNSDGALRMESWLAEMCRGCRHGREEGGLWGMGCELPARAYAEPYGDIVEWSADADPPGPDSGLGLRCMARQERTRGPKRPPGVGANHPTMFDPDILEET